MEFRRHPERRWRHRASAPFIYAVLVPLVILDILIELYHRVCFPLYGLPLVERGKYIRLDRHLLPYLRWWERVNCTYCGYANGLLRYASAIASQTERYWCSIQHEKIRGRIAEMRYQKDFLPYGDQGAFTEFVRRQGKKNK